MDDLISREAEALARKISGMTPDQFYRFVMTLCGSYLQKDAAPVTHGNWIEFLYPYENYCECSICNFTPDSPLDKTSYCPNCGAKMDLEDKNDNKN